MQQELDFTAARQARDQGMKQALDHAERLDPGWKDQAYAFLYRYATQHEQFISEDVSDLSRELGLPQPPTDRAWGSVYQRAARNKVIEHGGIGRSRRRHASICPLWKSLVYEGAAK